METLIEQFSSGLFIIQSIIFLILLFVLIKFGWKPILSSIETRENSITEAIEQAKKAREEMANLKSDNEKILKDARAERDAVLKEAREMKDKIISEAKNAAKSEGEKMLELAKNAIQNEKMAAMTEIKNQLANLSIDIAEKVLKKELSNKADQEALVQNLVKETNLN